MTYEKNPFEYEEIPDFAMKPAREAADIDSSQIDQFDPTPYDRILYGTEEAISTEPIFSVGLEPMVEALQPMDELTSPSMEAFAPMADMTAPRVDTIDLMTEEASLRMETADPVVEPLEPKETMELEIEDGVETAGPASILEESWQETANEVGETSVIQEQMQMVVPPLTVPLGKKVPIKMMPLVGALVNSKLKLIDIKEKPKTKVYIEEDILVPDVKPDLSTILAIDGKIKLSDKEVSAGQSGAENIKVTGDLIVETLYLPDTQVAGEGIVSIESKLPFRSECSVGAAPHSQILVYPEIESIDYTVINERKVRIKAVVVLALKEYGNLDIELFEGVKGEEVQMLKEKIRVTDVALRKTQAMEIKEDLALKESMPEIEKILKCHVNVVENHKQITKEKAVINASLYCNVMYLGKSVSNDSMKLNEEGKEFLLEPILYQGKTDFTQFIKLSDEVDAESKNLVGSKVDFDITSFNLNKRQDADGRSTGFELETNVDTTIELYQNIEKEIVTDVYHNVKDIQYETEELGLMSLSGSGASEVSVREIINIPEKNGTVDRIAYMSGEIKQTKATVDDGKSIVEGVATIKLICIAADDNKTAFNIQQEIPFRSSIEIPGAKADMSSTNQLTLKDLWFDKINNRQIEVNAGIAVSTTISKEEKHKLIKNVSFVEMPEGEHIKPSIILYITRAGDNIWKIAKKYRTTIDEIKKINDLEYANEIKPGTKLLIVAKSH